MFETVTLNKCVHDDAELNNLKNRVINATNQNLGDRFDNFEQDPVLSTARILEIRHWSNDHEQLAVFGEEEIKPHFKQLLEKNDFDQ